MGRETVKIATDMFPCGWVIINAGDYDPETDVLFVEPSADPEPEPESESAVTRRRKV
jgi:hypothetical protein